METDISHPKALLKRIFLFPRWAMLVPCRVVAFAKLETKDESQIHQEVASIAVEFRYLKRLGPETSTSPSAEISRRKIKKTNTHTHTTKKHWDMLSRWCSDTTAESCKTWYFMTPQSLKLISKSWSLSRGNICFYLKLFISCCLSILKGFRTIACWQFQLRFLEVGPEGSWLQNWAT